MIHAKQDFFAYSAECQRVRANLEQTYAAWVDVRRELEAMPVSMYWSGKDGADYLCIKQTSQDNGSSVGRRSPPLEAQYNSHVENKARLKARIHALDAQLTERAGLYRRLRLPAIPDRQAEILRKLDIEGLLGSDLMVVGTNAFIAYELAAGARFPTGNEETEDFDMAWCRGTKASLLRNTTHATGRKPCLPSSKAWTPATRSTRANPTRR